MIKAGQIVTLKSNSSKWKVIMLDSQDENNILVESCKTSYRMWAKPTHFII